MSKVSNTDLKLDWATPYLNEALDTVGTINQIDKLAALTMLFMKALEIIEPEPDREGLIKTPERMAKAWLNDLFAGYGQDASDFMTTFEGNGYNELVLVKDIRVSSMCEHHCLPFIGTAHVGYIPSDRIIGLSKIPRLVNMYAARMQVQERLTMQIADAMEEHLKPLGVMVVIDAVHTCMCMRGVRADGASTVTSAVKGVFLDDSKNSKSEFLRLIGK